MTDSTQKTAKRYTAEEKQQILEVANTSTNVAASKQFGVATQTISKWKEQEKQQLQPLNQRDSALLAAALKDDAIRNSIIELATKDVKTQHQIVDMYVAKLQVAA